jgi:hypothetical protein
MKKTIKTAKPTSLFTNTHHFNPKLSAAANFKTFCSFVQNNHDNAFRFISDILWSHITNTDTLKLSLMDEELFFALKSRVERVLKRVVADTAPPKPDWSDIDTTIHLLSEGYFPVIAPESIREDFEQLFAGSDFADWRAKLQFL